MRTLTPHETVVRKLYFNVTTNGFLLPVVSQQACHGGKNNIKLDSSWERIMAENGSKTKSSGADALPKKTKSMTNAVIRDRSKRSCILVAD